MKSPFRLMAAVITPCLQKGVVDFAAMRKLCGFLSTHGCDGLFVPSSTGEAMLLDDVPRRRLINAAREGSGPNTDIWAGVSGLGVHHALELSKAAAYEGANGVILMAPFFAKLSQPELIDYCTRIADASSVPVGIYHHPRMPTCFEPETIATLAEHPNIPLHKESSGDLDRLKEIIAITAHTNLRIYQGSEKLLLPSLEAGATGGITALSNPLPEMQRRVVNHFLSGNLVAAREQQAILERFWQIFRCPEVSGSFSYWLRTVTLPLCWRGLFPALSSMSIGAGQLVELDAWLKDYYVTNGLMDILMGEGRLDDKELIHDVRHDRV